MSFFPGLLKLCCVVTLPLNHLSLMSAHCIRAAPFPAGHVSVRTVQSRPDSSVITLNDFNSAGLLLMN